jgi:hypothetical protein
MKVVCSPGKGRLWLEPLLVLLVILFAACQVYIKRFYVSVDGIAFLDISSAIAKGDFFASFNGTWSPLYAWVLALFIKVVNPSPYWEFTLVQAANFSIFFLVTGCFRWFLKETYESYFCVIGEKAKGWDLPSWEAFICWAYCLYLWMVMDLIEVSQSNPDLLAAGGVFCAAAIMMRFIRGQSTWLGHVLFGVFLALGYFAKAALGAIGVLFLLTGCLMYYKRDGIKKWIVAGLVYSLLTLPYVAILSHETGYLTISDAGKFNYAIHVNKVRYRHWQGHEAGSGVPVHPTQELFNSPPTYFFERLSPATNAFWYDPSYWYRGVRIHFNATQQWEAMKQNVFAFSKIQIAILTGVVMMIAILGFHGRAVSLWLKSLKAYLSIFVYCLGALLMYSIIHLETRYIGTFLVILLTILGLCLAPRRKGRQHYVQVAGVGIIWLLIISGVIRILWFSERQMQREFWSSHWTWLAAQAGVQLGLTPGCKIALTEHSVGRILQWARVARVSIVAEVYNDESDGVTGRGDAYWHAAPEVRDKISEIFKERGICAIVTDTRIDRPPDADLKEWLPLGLSGLYIKVLRPCYNTFCQLQSKG